MSWKFFLTMSSFESSEFYLAVLKNSRKNRNNRNYLTDCLFQCKTKVELNEFLKWKRLVNTVPQSFFTLFGTTVKPFVLIVQSSMCRWLKTALFNRILKESSQLDFKGMYCVVMDVCTIAWCSQIHTHTHTLSLCVCMCDVYACFSLSSSVCKFTCTCICFVCANVHVYKYLCFFISFFLLCVFVRDCTKNTCEAV